MTEEAEGKSPAGPAPTRVLIVDDHPIFRAGVRERLEKPDSSIEVVGEAGDGAEACELVAQLRPDVVLLDIAMPGMNGVEAMRRIKAEWPEIGVLVLTLYDDDQYIYALIGAGAAGYLLKTAEGAELVGAVHRIRQGEAVLDPVVMQKLLDRLADGGRLERLGPSPLSEREHEVLVLAANGASNKVIAGRLNLSVRTVHAHMRNIFSKMGVASRTEAVMQAARRGWLEDGS